MEGDYMLYIDFDGVILDTEILLFEEWKKIPNRHFLPKIEKIKYIQNSDWEYIIKNSEVINDSICFLKEMDPNKTAILTKIHSKKEGEAKLRWAEINGILQKVILVPYTLKKTDVVDAAGNILIDDCLKNLYDWDDNNGKPILFDIDDDNIDSWHEPNIKGYEKVKSLSKYRRFHD